MALTSITVTTGATIDGRALARNGAVTLDTDTITNSCSAATTASATPAATSAASAASSGVPNTAFGPDSSTPELTTTLFALLLVLGLGALAVVNATIIRRRS